MGTKGAEGLSMPELVSIAYILYPVPVELPSQFTIALVKELFEVDSTTNIDYKVTRSL